MAGEVFSRYVVRSRIRALGLHVTAFRASQQGLERDVEIRVLPLAPVAGTKEPDRFAREFRALATFDHPNLIQVVDVGKTADHLFYVTYYRDARSLEELMQTELFDEVTVARAGRALGAALEYLHGRGFLHRSLSPSSVFHDVALDRFYIGDYSSMARPESDGGPDDVPLLRLGMTPEGRAGRLPDPRTDIYLLGATLYRMATGVDPLPALASASAPGVSPRAEPPGLHRPGLSRDTETFLMKMLEPDPGDRFQSAYDLLTAAEQLLKKLELKAVVERTSVSTGASGLETASVDRGRDTSPDTSSPGYSRARVRAAVPVPEAGISRAQIRAAQPVASAPAPAPIPEPVSRSAVQPSATPPGRAPLRTRAATAIRQSMKIARVAAGKASGGMLDRIGEPYRVPLILLGGFLTVALLAVLFGGRGRAVADAETVPADAPAVPSTAAAAPSSSGSSTGSSGSDATENAVRRAADQVRQAPTDLTNFRDRWQALRRWYVELPPAKRTEAFAYERLLKAKIDFAADPGGACRLLDDLYDKAGPQLQ